MSLSRFDVIESIRHSMKVNLKVSDAFSPKSSVTIDDHSTSTAAIFKKSNSVILSKFIRHIMSGFKLTASIELLR